MGYIDNVSLRFILPLGLYIEVESNFYTLRKVE